MDICPNSQYLSILLPTCHHKLRWKSLPPGSPSPLPKHQAEPPRVPAGGFSYTKPSPQPRAARQEVDRQAFLVKTPIQHARKRLFLPKRGGSNVMLFAMIDSICATCFGIATVCYWICLSEKDRKTKERITCNRIILHLQLLKY